MLNYKGGSTCCGKNTYVYVFSNFSIDEVYTHALAKNGMATAGLHERFNQY
jgi:hypothetical protein